MDYTLTSNVHSTATISRTPQYLRRDDRLRRYVNVRRHSNTRWMRTRHISLIFCVHHYTICGKQGLNSNLQTQLIQQDNPYTDLENITLLHFIVQLTPPPTH